jgi:hypothetical protein
MTIQKKRSPVWLQPRWERRKQETVGRVTAAIDQLKQQARKVTFSNICAAVKELYGTSISSNTLKRNDAAYQIYLAHRREPRRRVGRTRDLQDLVATAAGSERDQLVSKIARLRRESKDTLITKLITLERRVLQQTEVESRLREEIIRLDLASRGIESDQCGKRTVQERHQGSDDGGAPTRG